eukprot:1184909-Prorocentrum_minimum.AAC.1
MKKRGTQGPPPPAWTPDRTIKQMDECLSTVPLAASRSPCLEFSSYPGNLANAHHREPPDVKGYCVDGKGYHMDGKGYYVDGKGYYVDGKGYYVDGKGVMHREPPSHGTWHTPGGVPHR